jgi:hypothetical protein
MSMMDGDESYSDDDWGLDDGLEYSSQHSQEQQQGGTRSHRGAESQQQSTSSAKRGKRKGAYTEEERRYRRRMANRCVQRCYLVLCCGCAVRPTHPQAW